MCGIAGFVRGEALPAEREIIERMTATLSRRGPDGSGVHLDGPLALGHRRLSIIDLETGAQPLSNEDGSVWVTYNGELYNELVLRPRLEALGHRYKTGCDTETLVHLYEEHGLDFAAELNGMFAFALWDAPRRRLVLARDRMGQKPLYYTQTPDGGLVFGSEPKALLQHPDVPHALDPDGLARYLFYEYLPAPYSIWKGLRKLPRASFGLGSWLDLAPPVLDASVAVHLDGIGRFCVLGRVFLVCPPRLRRAPPPIRRAPRRLSLRRRRLLQHRRRALRAGTRQGGPHLLDRL